MQKKTKSMEQYSSGSDSDQNENDENHMDEEDIHNNEEAGPSSSSLGEKSEKKKKRGIIYISSIPKYMNVTILREILSQYAKVGRVYLQPGKLTSKFHMSLFSTNKDLN